MNSLIPSSFIPLCGLALVLALGGCGKSKSSGGGGAQTLAATVSNKLAAITASGEPVTLEELNKSYVEPPTGQNAATSYEHAFNALADEDPKAATFLAHNQKAVALLLQVPDRKVCRYPVVLTDGALALLPHLGKIKKCAALLKEEAINQAARGRTDAAAKATLAGLNLARSLDNEPILISKLVELASLMIALDGLEQALTRRAFSDDQLVSLQSALKEAESLASLRRAVVGERAFVIANFQTTDRELAKVGQALGLSPSKVTDLVAHRKKALFQEDFSFALDYLSTWVALPEEVSQSLDPAAQETMPKGETAVARDYQFSALLVPPFNKVMIRSAEAVAGIRATQTMLAVERYRLKHANALPASLAQLAPELLAAVPPDPFDNQPLRFRKLPTKGYVVYSVGKDRKDDGGIAKSPDGKTELDLVTIVGR